jgi:hypothetical protein
MSVIERWAGDAEAATARRRSRLHERRDARRGREPAEELDACFAMTSSIRNFEVAGRTRPAAG